MQELDDVFTRSNNHDVAKQLSRIISLIQDDIVQLQQDNTVLKGCSELPSEMFTNIKQGTLLNGG